MNESAEQSAPTCAAPTTAAPITWDPPWDEEQFTVLVRALAVAEAPRRFAIVEEYGERKDARVAGYGMAFEDRVEVNSVEGGFHLSSENAERARTLFEISSRSTGTRLVHLVWLDAVATPGS